jgi:hypothetical protein
MVNLIITYKAWNFEQGRAVMFSRDRLLGGEKYLNVNN